MDDLDHFCVRILEYLDNSLYLSFETKKRRIDSYDFESYPELLQIYNNSYNELDCEKGNKEYNKMFVHLFYIKLIHFYQKR